MKRGPLSESYSHNTGSQKEQSPFSQAGGSKSFSRIISEEIEAQ